MGIRGPAPAFERAERRTYRRPRAPVDLSPAQAELWRQIVATEPASLFGTAATAHLLRLYVEHAAFRAQVEGLIAAAPLAAALGDETAAGFDRLLRIRDRETRALVSLATRLRLTNQSRYSATAAASAGRNARPDMGDDDDPAAAYFN